MPTEEPSNIHCHLDELLADRGMTLTELSKCVGVSLVNLSVLKNEATGFVHRRLNDKTKEVVQESDVRHVDVSRH